MKKMILLLITLLILFNSFSLMTFSKDPQKKQKVKPINLQTEKVTKERTLKINEKSPQITFGTEDDELIPVNVKNEFDEEIKVKLDTNREYPVGPNEWITLGRRKPGRYTLTIYNKSGEFVDNLTKNIDNKNKFVLNKTTVSNSDKILGLSTGQKVAITAGAIGAAALGTALVNKALQESNNQETTYVPPPTEPLPEQVAIAPLVGTKLDTVSDANNAFAPQGKYFKFLNIKHEEVILVVEGYMGGTIGSNWVIPKANVSQKPQYLNYNGEKITISPEQKIKAVIPSGLELQRFAFELEIDPQENSYVWVLR